jgi:hypothetical protein
MIAVLIDWRAAVVDWHAAVSFSTNLPFMAAPAFDPADRTLWFSYDESNSLYQVVAVIGRLALHADQNTIQSSGRTYSTARYPVSTALRSGFGGC